MQIKTVKNPGGRIWKYFFYHCNHPIYNTCTLFDQNGIGLAVIQQRFNKKIQIDDLGSY